MIEPCALTLKFKIFQKVNMKQVAFTALRRPAFFWHLTLYNQTKEIGLTWTMTVYVWKTYFPKLCSSSILCPGSHGWTVC